MAELRKRLGRPLGSGGGPRFPHRITVPLSDEQYAELVARSEETGRTAAEIIRAALAATTKDTDQAIVNDLLANGFTRDDIEAIRRAALTASDRKKE